MINMNNLYDFDLHIKSFDEKTHSSIWNYFKTESFNAHLQIGSKMQLDDDKIYSVSNLIFRPGKNTIVQITELHNSLQMIKG